MKLWVHQITHIRLFVQQIVQANTKAIVKVQHYRPFVRESMVHKNKIPSQWASNHYSNVIIGAMASQITGVTSVCSIVCSGADQRKHRSSASLAFERGIHRWPGDCPHKGLVTQKTFQFDDVIRCGNGLHVMTSSWLDIMSSPYLDLRALR